ncbi:hypothetical protein EAI_08019 [Harpegnathos saltator]|uniref:Uncharacterized protein n=1 Tax=Harpegnathos saltator TaxID=610380 RepID=E2B3Q6_HARSA|nr:hypothetical protein EAI_08019 [Harpegnathos saltator]
MNDINARGDIDKPPTDTRSTNDMPSKWKHQHEQSIYRPTTMMMMMRRYDNALGTNEYANVRRDTDVPRNVSSDYENVDNEPPLTVLRKRLRCSRRIIAYTAAGITIAVLCGLAISSVFFIRSDLEALAYDNIDSKCYELWDDAINVSPITTTRLTRQIAGLDVTIRRDLHAL